MAEQGRGEQTTLVTSLNEVRARSLRKVVSLSGQFHANIFIYQDSSVGRIAVSKTEDMGSSP